jgi:hypothetical protein
LEELHQQRCEARLKQAEAEEQRADKLQREQDAAGEAKAGRSKAQEDPREKARQDKLLVGWGRGAT